MDRQEIIFLEGEGDQWFKRNQEPPATYDDPVLFRIKEAGIKPTLVLEVGCGTGWRLNRLDNDDCHCWGIDPSGDAIKYGSMHYPSVGLYQGTASDIDTLYPIKQYKFDLIIFGFCLYLCDREDLFRIVADTDKHLIDGGHIVIHDFLPEYPHCKPYHHVEGMFSYKQDYAQLWLANPSYTLVNKTATREGEAVVIIKKDINKGWPKIP